MLSSDGGPHFQRSDSEVAVAVPVNNSLTQVFGYLHLFIMEELHMSLQQPDIPNSTSDIDNSTSSDIGTKMETQSEVATRNQGLMQTYYFCCTFMRCLIVPCILILVICLLWEKYCVSLRDKTCNLPLPNGRMGFPIVGEMFHFLFLGVTLQRARRKEFGPIYRTHLFGRPTIRVSGEKYIKKLLLGEGQLVETKWPYTTQVILGSDGIVNGCKKTHTTIKRLTLRALSPRFMETYASSVQRSVKRHVANWNDRSEIHVLEECKQLITKTMMTVLLGIREDDPDIQKYITAADDIINGILCIPLDTPYSSWRKGKQARKFIFEKLKTTLKSKMECRDDELFSTQGFSTANRPVVSSIDELAALSGSYDSVLVNIIKIARLEGETSLQLKNLQNLALEIIFAGTQSLQSSSSLLILHLSQHPEVLDKLRKEIKANGLWDTSLEEIPYAKVNSLSYVSHVVNEVLRVTPPIPGAIRLAKKTFDLGGYQVPKGWQVMFSIRETHEMASGREKPLQAAHLEYNPSYFACGKCEKQKQQKSSPVIHADDNIPHICHNKNGPFSFIPFGKGSRMCAGVNYALFVLRVLTIEVVRKSNFRPTTPIKLKCIPMTKPAHSVKVSFKPLSPSSHESC
ncbi:cytochrome P450 26B1-like [Styela clava]